MVRGNLTRKQPGERHGISTDRVTQWLCLLKLLEDKLRDIESFGDYWEKQVVPERAERAKTRDSY
jgi:hypothetical protein